MRRVTRATSGGDGGEALAQHLWGAVVPLWAGGARGTLGALGLALFAGLLPAAVFPRFTAEDLMARSEAIVEGRVTRSWTAWDAKRKYIWTHYSVAVSDTLRGTRTLTFIVSEPGGSLDGINQASSGSMAYDVGETDVLFLSRTPIGYWRAMGGPQGRFRVNADGRVHADLSSATYAGSERPAAGTPIPSFEGLTIVDFKSRMRRLASSHPFRRELQ
jgi:hypothetical protein